MKILRDFVYLGRDTAGVVTAWVRLQTSKVGVRIQRTISRVVGAVVLGLIGGLILLVGVLYALWGLWAWMSVYMHPGAAALILGGVLILLAAWVLLVARLRCRAPAAPPVHPPRTPDDPRYR